MVSLAMFTRPMKKNWVRVALFTRPMKKNWVRVGSPLVDKCGQLGHWRREGESVRVYGDDESDTVHISKFKNGCDTCY